MRESAYLSATYKEYKKWEALLESATEEIHTEEDGFSKSLIVKVGQTELIIDGPFKKYTKAQLREMEENA